MKSGCIDFVNFVDKLVSRLTEGGDHHILRTNHVTLLIAEIIRVELVIDALNKDARKVVFEMCKFIAFLLQHCNCAFLLLSLYINNIFFFLVH